MNESKELYDTVIRNDYCIGCGVCEIVQDSPFIIKMNEFGNLIAHPISNLEKNTAKVLSICPFSNSSKNEDELSEIFLHDAVNKDARIGRYIECFAGFVNTGKYREMGSSGGIGKWLGYTLMKEDEINYFVQVASNQTKYPGLPLFDYYVYSDKDAVIGGSKSSYYPVSLNNILKIIRYKEGNYAITGIPCLIKALRLLSYEDEIIRHRVKYYIGIVCGGMKSANHAKIIGWQLGVDPKNLTAIDFRKKYTDKSAKNKIYQVWSNIDEIPRYRDAGEIFGTDWGAGFFKPNACDYCDDIVNELADISIGDAWLPQFEDDPKGTSMLIIRNRKIFNLLNKHLINNNISLIKLTPQEVVMAQKGAFRHRREALSLRISQKKKLGLWVPQKRINPKEFIIKRKRREIYYLREKIAKQSHLSSLSALKNHDLRIFYKELNPLVKKYHRLNYGNFIVRGLRKIILIVASIALPVRK